LITGASRSIGRHIALALAHQGMELVLAARSQDGLDAVADEVRSTAGVTVSTLTVDLGDRAQAAVLGARAEEVAGRVDVLVNNAGLESARLLTEVTVDELAAMTEVNLLAPMVLTRAVLPGMIERGRGHVVNVSSMAGLIASAYQESYSATKFGLVGFTLALRMTAQDAGWGLSASAVCPGFIAGDGMYADMQAEFGVTTPKSAGDLPAEMAGDAVVEAAPPPRPSGSSGSVRRLDVAAPFRTVANRRSAGSD
jgi:short-subunit dehydrogenase